jgi:hypothetical protein
MWWSHAAQGAPSCRTCEQRRWALWSCSSMQTTRSLTLCGCVGCSAALAFDQSRLHGCAAAGMRRSAGGAQETLIYATTPRNDAVQSVHKAAKRRLVNGRLLCAVSWIPRVLDRAVLLAVQDPEPRVRAALAECLGAMARREGPSVYERCGGALVSTINACFVSRPHSPALCVCNSQPRTLRLIRMACIVHDSSPVFGKLQCTCRYVQSRDAEEAAAPSGDTGPDDFFDSLLEESYKPQRPGQVLGLTDNHVGRASSPCWFACCNSSRLQCKASH